VFTVNGVLSFLDHVCWSVVTDHFSGLIRAVILLNVSVRLDKQRFLNEMTLDVVYADSSWLCLGQVQTSREEIVAKLVGMTLSDSFIVVVIAL